MATATISDVSANGIPVGSASGTLDNDQDPWDTLFGGFSAASNIDTVQMNGLSAGSPSIYLLDGTECQFSSSEVRDITSVLFGTTEINNDAGSTVATIRPGANWSGGSFGELTIRDTLGNACIRGQNSATGATDLTLSGTKLITKNTGEYGLRWYGSAILQNGPNQDWSVVGDGCVAAGLLFDFEINDSDIIITGGSVTGDYERRVFDLKDGTATGCTFSATDTVVNIAFNGVDDSDHQVLHFRSTVSIDMVGMSITQTDDATMGGVVFLDTASGAIDTSHLRITDSIFESTGGLTKYGLRIGDEGSVPTRSITDSVISGNTLANYDHGFFFGRGVSNATGSRNTSDNCRISYLIKYGDNTVGWVGNNFTNVNSADTQAILNIKASPGGVIANISGTVPAGRSTTVISVAANSGTNSTLAQVKNLDITMAGAFTSSLIEVAAGSTVDASHNNFNITSPDLDDDSYFSYQGSALTAREWALTHDNDLTINGFAVPQSGGLVTFVGLEGTGTPITTLTNPITDLNGNAWAPTPSRGATELAVPQTPSLTSSYSNRMNISGDVVSAIDFSQGWVGADSFVITGLPNGLIATGASVEGTVVAPTGTFITNVAATNANGTTNMQFQWTTLTTGDPTSGINVTINKPI